MRKDKFENIVVAAGIIWRHGYFLASQRLDGKSLAGYWELPGGKLEGNETPEEALRRELAEELGINIIEFQPLKIIEYTYPERGFHVTLHFFYVNSFKGEPCPAEGQNLRWICPAEIKEIDFLPADRELLESLALGDIQPAFIDARVEI